MVRPQRQCNKVNAKNESSREFRVTDVKQHHVKYAPVARVEIFNPNKHKWLQRPNSDARTRRGTWKMMNVCSGGSPRRCKRWSPVASRSFSIFCRGNLAGKCLQKQRWPIDKVPLMDMPVERDSLSFRFDLNTVPRRHGNIVTSLVSNYSEGGQRGSIAEM